MRLTVISCLLRASRAHRKRKIISPLGSDKSRPVQWTDCSPSLIFIPHPSAVSLVLDLTSQTWHESKSTRKYNQGKTKRTHNDFSRLFVPCFGMSLLWNNAKFSHHNFWKIPLMRISATSYRSNTWEHQIIWIKVQTMLATKHQSYPKDLWAHDDQQQVRISFQLSFCEGNVTTVKDNFSWHWPTFESPWQVRLCGGKVWWYHHSLWEDWFCTMFHTK